MSLAVVSVTSRRGLCLLSPESSLAGPKFPQRLRFSHRPPGSSLCRFISCQTSEIRISLYQYLFKRQPRSLTLDLFSLLKFTGLVLWRHSRNPSLFLCLFNLEKSPRTSLSSMKLPILKSLSYGHQRPDLRCFSEQIPIIIVLKAMGMESDQEIVQMVGRDPCFSASLLPSFEECVSEGVYTRKQALDYLEAKVKKTSFGPAPEQKSVWNLHCHECKALSRLDKEKRKFVTPTIRRMVKISRRIYKMKSCSEKEYVERDGTRT